MSSPRLRLLGLLMIGLLARTVTSPSMDAVWLCWTGSEDDGLCSCACPDGPWEETWGRYEAVFSGRLMAEEVGAETRSLRIPADLDEAERKTLMDDYFLAQQGSRSITVDVDHVWAPGAHLNEPVKAGEMAVLFNDGLSCPARLETGRRYLIYGYGGGDVLTTNACLPNRRWSALDDVMLAFNVGRPPNPPLMVPSQIRQPLALAWIGLLLIVLWRFANSLR